MSREAEFLFRDCLQFVQEQSSGEWGETVERQDAEKLVAFVQRQIVLAKDPPTDTEKGDSNG